MMDRAIEEDHLEELAMPIQFTAKDPPETWAASYRGPRRENEDDYARADHQTRHYDWRRKGCLYVLADGMGGLTAGREAARTTVQEVVKFYIHRGDPTNVPASVKDAVQHANDLLYRAAERTRGRMGSTIAACVLKDGFATIAHVGDSRVYQLSGGTLHRRTRDHLYSTEVLGIKNDDDAKRQRGGHIITRSVGTKPDLEVEVKQIPYQPRDRFLLCSDGFTQALDSAEIGHCLNRRSPRAVVRELEKLSAGRLKDNASVVVVFASGRAFRLKRLALNALVVLLALCALALIAVDARRGLSQYQLSRKTPNTPPPTVLERNRRGKSRRPTPTGALGPVTVTDDTSHPVWFTIQTSSKRPVPGYTHRSLKPHQGKPIAATVMTGWILTWRYAEDLRRQPHITRLILQKKITDKRADLLLKDPHESIWLSLPKTKSARRSTSHRNGARTEKVSERPRSAIGIETPIAQATKTKQEATPNLRAPKAST